MQKTCVALALVSLYAIPIVAMAGAEDVLIADENVQVTRDDLVRYIETRIPEEHRQMSLARPGAVRELISQVFITRKLANEAELAGYADSEDIVWRIQLQKDRVLMEALLEDEIARDFASKDWNKIVSEFYQANRDTFKVPESVRVSHILIDTASRTDSEARELANGIVTKLKSGMVFQELAIEFSDDPSVANNKGDLGFVTRGQLVPEFEKVAFQMNQEGEIAGPVKTQFGYHIIRFEERRDSRVRALEEASSQIMHDLQRQHAVEVRQRMIERVRMGDGIVVDHDLVDSIESELKSRPQEK